jgi:glycosyltransferase involved in cell wall biosynthesis
LGVPLVVTFHGFRPPRRPIRRRALGAGDTRSTSAAAETLKRETRLFIAVRAVQSGRGCSDRGFPESKVVVHTIGVDTELFRSDPPSRASRWCSSSAASSPRRGSRTWIAAMREVQARLPEADLVLVGGRGELQTELERQARELGVRARASSGMVKPEEVREWMKPRVRAPLRSQR